MSGESIRGSCPLSPNIGNTLYSSNAPVVRLAGFATVLVGNGILKESAG